MRLMPESAPILEPSAPAPSLVAVDTDELLALARRVGTPLSTERPGGRSAEGFSLGRVMSILVNGTERDSVTASEPEARPIDFARLLREIVTLEAAATSFAVEANQILGSGVRSVTFDAERDWTPAKNRIVSAAKRDEARSIARLTAQSLESRIAHLENLRPEIARDGAPDLVRTFEASLGHLRELAVTIARLGQEPSDRRS